MIPAKQLSDEEMIKLREEKVELNRKSRRITGMKTVCVGKAEGLLECVTVEGRCPEFNACHGLPEETPVDAKEEEHKEA